MGLLAYSIYMFPRRLQRQFPLLSSSRRRPSTGILQGQDAEAGQVSKFQDTCQGTWQHRLPEQDEGRVAWDVSLGCRFTKSG